MRSSTRQNKMEKQGLKNLKKRYLIWFYKTTKEALDKVERKFTQLEVDRFILKELKHLDKDKKAQNLIEEFETYIAHKEKDGMSLKFEGKEAKPEYLFLDLKLKAIEKTIVKELGKNALGEIKSLYEAEMVKRILEERQIKT